MAVLRMGIAGFIGLLVGAMGYAVFRGDVRWGPAGSTPSELAAAAEPDAVPRTPAPRTETKTTVQAEATDKADSKRPKSAAAGSDWLIVPGVRVGPVRPDTTEADLRRLLGESNVAQTDVYLGEGTSEPGLAVFPNQPERTLHVLWRQGAPTVPREVRIVGREWKTEQGIRLGTTLRQLEEMNGRPFELAGFAWDYSGTVLGWEGGKLDQRLESRGRLLLRLGPERSEQIPEELEGSGAFPSSHPAMQALNPSIYQLILIFPDDRREKAQLPPRSADLAASIAGRWLASIDGGFLAFELTTSGELSLEMRNWPTPAGPMTGVATGRWLVAKNRFEGRIETSNTRAFPVGYAWSDEIVEAPTDRLVLKNQDGRLESYERVPTGR